MTNPPHFRLPSGWLVCFTVIAGLNGADLQSGGAPTGAPQLLAIEQRIASARKSSDPVALAEALIERGRIYRDPEDYREAQLLLNPILKSNSQNFNARKLRAAILLATGEFQGAIDEALLLNKQVPDDVSVYGYLTEGYAHLGKYKDAEDACQWMLNLRPGNVPALIETAYLREIFGEVDGAIDTLTSAHRQTAPSEPELRSWIVTEMARLRVQQGRLPDAGKLLQQTVEPTPDFPPAIEVMAQIRMTQGKFAEAAALLRRLPPRAQILYRLAQALRQNADEEGSSRTFTEFVAKAKQDPGARPELVFYYAGEGHQADKALQIAQSEFASRQDVFTLDAYAWALHVTGDDAEARKQMNRVLAVGTRTPAILQHAAALGIVASADDTDYLKKLK